LEVSLRGSGSLLLVLDLEAFFCVVWILANLDGHVVCLGGAISVMNNVFARLSPRKLLSVLVLDLVAFVWIVWTLVDLCGHIVCLGGGDGGEE
jgi:hypothetical protein